MKKEWPFGTKALDPHNRHVEIVGHVDEPLFKYVTVRLAGTYGATFLVSPSALRKIEEKPS